MRNRNSLQTGINNKLKTRLAWGAGGAAVVVLAGYLLSDFLNGFYMKINPNQVVYYGMNFINTSSATIENEGQAYFGGDVTNDGTMNCGECIQGTSYLVNDADTAQTIGGEKPISWFNVVVDNAGGVDLKNELQIVNSLSFADGLIRTDRNKPTEVVHFMEGAIHGQVSPGNHVDGYVKKTGAESFAFPIGDGNRLMTAIVYPRNPSDVYEAAYFNENPNDAGLPLGGPFSTIAFEKDFITRVHQGGYWDIKGSEPTRITLMWDEKSEIAEIVEEVGQLGVAGWDGDQWAYLSQTSVSGDLKNGTVSSNILVPDDYVAFTIANISEDAPSKWLRFDVTLVGNDAKLEWVTAYEQNSEIFEIERSPYGLQFGEVGATPALGGNTPQKTEYEYIDPNVTSLNEPRLYYRLKEIFVNESYDYSYIVELDLAKDSSDSELIVYPNPTTDYTNVLLRDPDERWYELEQNANFPFLDLNDVVGADPSIYQLDIINLAGMSVFREKIRSNKSKRVEVGEWAQGVYVVSVSNGAKKYAKQLIVSR